MGGKTQLHLRNRCQTIQNKRRYKYSFDASSFDQTLPGFVMSLFFLSIDSLFSANNSTTIRIKQLMRYELIAGYYHSSFRVIKRRIGGLLSGSGLTNQLGTFSTTFMAICQLLCMGYTIDEISDNFDFMVTGDDLVIFSDSELDHGLFIKLSHENFGIVYNLDTELIGSPSNDVFEFAGSVWKNGYPYRNWVRFLSALSISLSVMNENLLFGSNGNSIYNFILARAVELSGNSTDCLEFLEAIGFKFEHIQGKTVYIYSNLIFESEVDYHEVLTKVSLPKTRDGFRDICLSR